MKKKVAIFIDYKNTLSAINRAINEKYISLKKDPKHSLYKLVSTSNGNEKSIDYLRNIVWKNFNSILLKSLIEKNPKLEYFHAGTFITLGIRKVTKEKNLDKTLYHKIMDISKLDGFIVTFEVSKEINNKSIKEYGVDARIACQMLLGAFYDQYDYAILVSDDQDFIPAINMVQKSYGKRVYHLGSTFSVKSVCYGSLDYDKFFTNILELNNYL